IGFLSYPGAPLSGTVELSATGNGTFDAPRNDFKLRISDLSVADERVGEVTAQVALRGKDLTGKIDAASPRLAITGTGRLSLTPGADCDISFRFHDSSIDQYARLFLPKLSASTTAVASGAIRIVGTLSDLNNLAVNGTVDALNVRLFDYAVKNAAPLQLSLDH